MNYLHLLALKIQKHILISLGLLTLMGAGNAQAQKKTASIISFQRCAQLLDLSAGPKVQRESLPVHKELYEIWEAANKNMWMEVQQARKAAEAFHLKLEELDKTLKNLEELKHEYGHLLSQLN